LGLNKIDQTATQRGLQPQPKQSHGSNAEETRIKDEYEEQEQIIFLSKNSDADEIHHERHETHENEQGEKDLPQRAPRDAEKRAVSAFLRVLCGSFPAEMKRL
jgi:hypothetical protein